MRKRLYSMWAKILVVVILLAVAVYTGLCASWVLVGLQRGMTVSEVMEPVPYEQSEEAVGYLRQESMKILEKEGLKEHFQILGKTYDENATVDISDDILDVNKTEKTPGLEYSLKALSDFYDTDGYALLVYLIDNREIFVNDSADEEAEDYDGSVTETAAPRQERAGAQAKSTGETEVFVNANNGIREIFSTMKWYDNDFDVLYNNGIEIEKQYIQNPSGQTLADYAFVNNVNLLALYDNLRNAAASVHEFKTVSEEETNAMIYVKNADTGMVYSNIDEWKTFTDAQEAEESYMNMMAENTRNLFLCVDETQNYEKMTTIQSNLYSIRYLKNDLLEECRSEFGDGQYQLFVGLNTGYPLQESSSAYYAGFYEWYFINQPIFAFFMMFAGLGVIVVLLIVLCCQTGHRPEDKEIHLTPMDAVPLEILIVIDIICWGALLAVAAEWGMNYQVVDSYQMQQQAVTDCVAGTIGCTAGIAILAWQLKHYLRRIKAKALGGCLIRSAVIGIRKAGSAVYRSRKENERLVIAYTLFLLLHFIVLLLMGAIGSHGAVGAAFIIVLILIVFDIYVMTRLTRLTSGRDEVKKGMEELSRGNLDYKINTDLMSGDNLEMAEGLNRVQNGLKKAVETEMKSERLKTDLITNVSHDIKTPLTSIINYVDILKRENIQDEKIAGYIDILDRKSLRLKQLTEDLVEASKISSGNITLEMQDINLKQLIKQTNGEFEERFAEKNLELVCSLPESQMLIRADGRRMFRVIENLYNNAAKYSMPNSRVYINGEIKGGKIIFSMKNMSESPLNFKADELLERFVRGDVSRSTEGSGLGLEIARNLTIMQKGTFDLYLDGDLFKVTITFDAI